MTNLLPRLLFTEIKKYLNSPEAIVITGFRRVGKTFLLHYIYNYLTSTNKLFLDLENPLNRKVFEELNYEKIKTNLEERRINFSAPAFIFLDEIQWCKSIPSVVKYLIDHYQTKFFLTGSASFYLKNLFSESLSGRKFIFELFPLSFGEFLIFKNSPVKLQDFQESISQVYWKTIEPYWQEYFNFGGFPQVVLAPDFLTKDKLLEDVFTAYFQNEIEHLADFRKTGKVRDFITLLVENIGNLLNLERFSSELGISRLTLEEWLYFLEASYLIGLVPPYSQKERVAIRKAKKIYFIDWGLANKITPVPAGQRFENCLFHLLRPKGELFFFRKKSGVEIDFILGKKVAFEAKIKGDAGDKKLIERLSTEIGLKKSYVIDEKSAFALDKLPKIWP